jgi:hypothetical protein
MCSVSVCAFFCVCVQTRRADHPSKESYRLSLIKKLRKLSPILQKREQAPKCGSNEEEKNYRVGWCGGSRELLCSNLGRGTGHPDGTFSWFPWSLQANPGQCLLGHNCFVLILPDSLLANYLRVHLDMVGDTYGVAK